MKFIKTADGWYIDRSKIDSLTVDKYFDSDGKGYVVRAYIAGHSCRLKEFACDPKSTTQFDPETEAEAWLDKFVRELNEG